MVDKRRVAALRFDEILELLERGTVGEVALHGLLGRERRARNTRETHNLHAELEHEFLHVLGTFALEQRDGFLDLQRGADGIAQRLVHVGDERDAAALHGAADAGH